MLLLSWLLMFFLTNVSFDVRLRWNFLMELFMDTHVGCMMVDRLL